MNKNYIIIGLTIIIFTAIIIFMISTNSTTCKDCKAGEIVSSASTESTTSTQTTKINTIQLSEFKEKLATKEYQLIDIRTPEEFNSGYIADAMNIDYYSNTFLSELNKLDKSKKYLIYCRTGSRTGNAIKLMKEAGFTEVYDLKGGITLWQSSGEPIITQ